MTCLLVIEASPRFEHSTSRVLTSQFVEKWSRLHPNASVIRRDLARANLQFVDLPWIGAAFTPPDQHSPESAAALQTSNVLIEELKAAHHIVIGTPMYNFSIPALLKAYIDQIVRIGVTVSTTYEGMLKGKQATVILTTGGTSLLELHLPQPTWQARISNRFSGLSALPMSTSFSPSRLSLLTKARQPLRILPNDSMPKSLRPQHG